MKVLNKNIFIVIMFAASLSLFFFGMNVYARSSASVSGRLETGVVELELSAEKEDAGPVLPGQTIAYIPKITNKGNECYIRAKYDFGVFSKYAEALGFADGWKQANDGFWYYTGSLRTDESIDFFKEIRISPDLPEETSGCSVSVDVTAQAVQKKNFEPDFTGSRPWGGLEIEKYTKSEKYRIIEGTAEAMPLSISYEADADKLISNSSRFLEDLPILLPGDVYISSIILKNTYGSPIDLYFFSEADQKDALLKNTDLKITSSDRGTVYEGKLIADKINGAGRAVLLSSVNKGKDEQITFTLSVPKELKNEFTLWKSPVKWTFTTDVTKRSEPSPTPVPSKISVPKTGDNTETGFYCMLFGAAAFIMTLGVMLARKRKEGVHGKRR